ncbi:polyisoprenoid-binding protein YceI [Breoghania corrubedonensis]|uniref:Polyisoprenoid-binding protein YceI n=1 Tax=Breoghania corrubedonensis TaxID=665038 RepID=A0A2T5UWB9_9HYPH|nr:YceI family protein [Breoghania corrubedonensis]PTW55761.1 polyisoprenoid-binding protein YceI [Breoghania corrubedonensis]
MNKLIAGAVAFAVLAAPSLAATSANAAEWAVDHGASKLIFKVRQGDKLISGSFGKWDAKIDMDPEAPETATIEVTVDTSSVATDDGQMGQTLTGEAWLATGKFAKATFSSDEVVPTGEGTYDAVGTLTIKDIAVPMTLPFMLKVDGDKAEAKGGSTLERQDYKIGSEIDDATLDGTVKVEFDVVASKK